MKDLASHLLEISNRVRDLECKELTEILAVLEKCYSENKTVFVAGNGGSATIAAHFATDWSKGVFENTGKSLKTFSLSSNFGLFSAISNDIGYQSSISYLIPQFATPGDVLFLVSSSGASSNIIEAARIGKKAGMSVLSLSGFNKSMLWDLSDHCLTIDSFDYQVIEDLHSIVGHLVLKHFNEKYGSHARS